MTKRRAPEKRARTIVELRVDMRTFRALERAAAELDEADRALRRSAAALAKAVKRVGHSIE